MLTGENGMLTQAQNADDETRAAAVQEQVDLWNSNKRLDENIGEKTAQSREDLVENLQNQGLLTLDDVADIEATGQVTIGSKTIVFGTDSLTLIEMFEQAQKDDCINEDGSCKREDHLHIGDYVSFQNPTSGSSSISPNESGINATQTYSAENNRNLTWKVLGIEDRKIKLIAGTPMKLDSIEGKNDPYLYLYGAWAYEYGPDAMDKVVRDIYGNLSNVADARSVKMKDIDQLTGVTTEEKVKEFNLDKYYGSKQYGEFFSYTNQYTPESWLNGKKTVTVEGNVNGYYYTINSPVGSGAPYASMNNARAYNMLFGNIESQTGAKYWLSYQGVSASLIRAGFGPGVVDSTNGVARTGGYGMFKSDGNESIKHSAAVRPVVILQSNITCDTIKKLNDQTEEKWNYSGEIWNIATCDEE